MAARKLATEIDRTLKRVAEGVEQFEDLYDKMQKSQNQPQKEKMEADLKTQIKKLQRLRDQIKTWLTSNEIKDKKALLENRKLIETQMERFKATEKEMKTKAFSKEGLIAAARMDPAEKAKMEVTQWISNQVDELARQVEASEAEIEQLAGSGKKKKSSGAASERSAELEHLNERRGWHISRLEILLRLLENGRVETEEVEAIKEDVAYFVESNAEEDFEEDEGIYDDFNLDEEEEAFGLKENEDMMSSHDGASVSEDHAPPKPAKEVLKNRRESEDRAAKPEPPTAPKKVASTRKASAELASKEAAAKAIPAANFAAAKAPPATSPSVVSPPKAPAAQPLPPIRYAAAAAAAVSPTSTPAGAAAAPAQPGSVSPVASASQVSGRQTSDSSPAPSSAVAASDQAAITNSPVASHAAPPAQASASRSGGGAPSGSSEASKSPSMSSRGAHAGSSRQLNGSAKASPVLTNAAASASGGISSAVAAPGAALDGSGEAVQGQQQQQQQQQPQAAGQASAAGAAEMQPGNLAASSAAAATVQPLGGGAGTASQQLQAQKQQGTVDVRLPSSLSDLVTSFESAKQKSLRRDNNVQQVHKSLESGFMNLPEPQDSDKPNYYTPRNPWPTPAYYPQMPASIFDNPALYSKLEEDTLFYIFYYSHRNWWRYLAAKELKRQSWRFSTRYATWFRRHAEPTTINEEYEEGSYIYFDYESSWCQRRKAQFRFEYMYLESEL